MEQVFLLISAVHLRTAGTEDYIYTYIYRERATRFQNYLVSKNNVEKCMSDT